MTSPLAALSRLQLSDSAKLCWSELARFAGARGYCWPGQRTLCGLLGWSERKLQYVLRELRNAGVLRVERRGQGRTSVYHLGNPRNVENPVETGVDSAQIVFDFAAQDPQTACGSIYEVPSEITHTTQQCASVVEQERSRGGQPAREPPTAEIPPECVEDRHGRLVLNPAFLRVRDALMASEEKIRRARAPDRYRAAIIRRAMGGGP